MTGANPWHGELRDPVVLEQLAERFGPDRVWSASQLQLYGRCPFLYLTERVLYLTPSEEAEEETSALQVGSIAHAILDRFYSSVKSRVPVALEDGAASTLHQITEAVFQDLEDEREWLGHPVLWRHRKEEIREIVRAYVEWELPYLADKGERPWECELALGGDTGFVEIQGPDLNNESRTMRIRGRVDRVDAVQGGERSVYRILDYKTSYVPAAKGYKDGSHVQAPLYMAGVEAERGIEVACARYRALKRPGSPQNGAQINAGPKAEAALRFAFSIPDRIRSGVFEPVMAGADEWKPWDPGIELTRGRVQLADGSRFDADGSRFDADGSRFDADAEARS